MIEATNTMSNQRRRVDGFIYRINGASFIPLMSLIMASISYRICE